ncbi:MAG: hypothetical protein KDB61_16200, partial [Planctomycetes bacterium]|nr:hypothetical protein [Planctomycetota bacterium]
VGGNKSQEYTISGIVPNTTPPKNVQVWITPSIKKSVDGTLTAMNTTNLFQFDFINNMFGSGIAKCYRGALSLPITNNDDQHDITEVEIKVSFPTQTSVSVTEAYFLNKGELPESGATITQNSGTITITGFPPISDGDLYYVVLKFNETLDGDIVRTVVQATFN